MGHLRPIGLRFRPRTSLLRRNKLSPAGVTQLETVVFPSSYIRVNPWLKTPPFIFPNLPMGHLADSVVAKKFSRSVHSHSNSSLPKGYLRPASAGLRFSPSRIHAVEEAIKARLGSVFPGGMAVSAVLSGRDGRDARAPLATCHLAHQIVSQLSPRRASVAVPEMAECFAWLRLSRPPSISHKQKARPPMNADKRR